MKIIYTGAEYHLSAYLNAIKVPMVLLLALILLITSMQVLDGKPFKESIIGKHWKLYSFFVLLVSMYIPLVWK